MNRLAHWMMRLYPSRWRRRYGEELDALLGDTGADMRVVADLAKGGVRMQFSTWSFAKLAVVLGFAGLLLGAGGSFLISPMYVSKATVRVEPLTEAMQEVAPLVLSRRSLADIINNRQWVVVPDGPPFPDPKFLLYTDELKTTPLEDVIEEMRSNIRIDAVPAASAFTISFQYSDPARAQRTVAALIGKFEEESERLQRSVPEAAGKQVPVVVDTASLPVQALLPGRRLVELAGCLFGLSIPLLWRIIRKKHLLTWGFAISGLVCGFAGVLAGDVAVILELVGVQYHSSALMSMQNGTSEQIRELADKTLSRTSLSGVIQDPRTRLYQEQLKTEPLEDVVENMQKHLSIAEAGSGGHYFTVSFEYRDRYKAQQAVQVLMNRISEGYGQTVTSQPAAHAAWGKPEVLEKPSAPVMPVSPDRYKIAGEGGIAGLFAAAIIALIRRRWRPEGEIPVDAVDG